MSSLWTCFDGWLDLEFVIFYIFCIVLPAIMALDSRFLTPQPVDIVGFVLCGHVLEKGRTKWDLFISLIPKNCSAKKSPEPKMKKDLELRRPRHRRHTQGAVEPVQTSLFIFLFRLIKFCKRNFFWFLIRLTLSLTTILHLSPRHRPVSVSV